MKNVLLAFDSYKGSMDACKACETAKLALENLRDGQGQVYYQCHTLPLADGGEGTVDAFLTACGGHKVYTTVTGPYGQPVDAFYGILSNQTVIIEMAAASGLTLPGNLMHPIEASTIGTGELILHAVEKGYTNFIIGLGGSATNDGGMGMAHSLGARFIDAQGQMLSPRASNLLKINAIHLEHWHPSLVECRFVAACDVRNPLFGPMGASVVFGPQKGASPSDVQFLDQSLRHYAQVLEKTFHRDYSGEGTGAAGGLGAGLMAFLGATYVSGIDLLLSHSEADRWLMQSHYILTGEGLLDHQSLMGKVLVGLGSRAKNTKAHLISFPGHSTLQMKDWQAAGLEAVYPIQKKHQTLPEAMIRAEENLYEAVTHWGQSQISQLSEKALLND